MKPFFILVSLIVLAGSSVRAADETATTDKAKTDTPAATKPLVSEKNQSSFTMEESERNPFWPIGWKPVAKTGTETATGPSVPSGAFLVSSITLGENEHFAIINGKIMKEGEQFGLQMGNQTYQITVKAIEDGQVRLQRRDEEIVVPLRRK